MQSVKRICKVKDNEVWINRCLKCNSILEEQHGERLFCWDCWIRLKKKENTTKTDMIKGHKIVLEIGKEINDTPIPQIMGIFDTKRFNNKYFESPTIQVNYNKKQHGIFFDVIMFFKLTGNSMGIREITNNQLDFVIHNNECITIEEQLPFKKSVDAWFNEYDVKDIKLI